MSLDNWGQALFRMASAIIPMYIIMGIGVLASRWNVIDKAGARGTYA